jgi:hypothetical protein
MKVRIHIERVVLDGPSMTKSQLDRLRAAVESELAQLVQTGHLSPELLAGGAIRGISVPTIPERAAHAPVGLGNQIARAVFRGIGSDHGRMLNRRNGGPGRGNANPAAGAGKLPAI